MGCIYRRPSHSARRGSEDVDGRETGLARDAVPKINCQADVTCPKRIPAAAGDGMRAAILDDGRHRELACAVEPNGIVGAAGEVEGSGANSPPGAAKAR